MTSTYDLNDMMLFISVVDAGSFTSASEALNIPKANVSRRIARLEEKLGVRLLERTTRSQHITDAGRRYLAHCRRIRHETELANATVAQILDEVQGELRVGVSVGIAHEVLKPVLAKFLHQYPDINLRVDLGNDHVDLIEQGYDLSIRIGKLQDSLLISKKLGTIKRKIYVSPQYLNRFGKLNSLDQLSNCDFLMMSSVVNNQQINLQNGDGTSDLSVSPRLLIDDFTILKQMIVDGLGVGVIPSYMCLQDVKEGRLVQIIGEWGMSDVDVYALYPKHKLKIPKVKAFMTFIEELFKTRLSS